MSPLHKEEERQRGMRVTQVKVTTDLCGLPALIIRILSASHLAWVERQ